MRNSWQSGKEKGDMLEVNFYDTVDDDLLKFAVIISQSNGKWVMCKHKERDTYEVPVDIVKKGKIFWRLLKENFKKKQVPLSLI